MYRKSDEKKVRFQEDLEAIDREEPLPKRKREPLPLREIVRKKLYEPGIIEEWHAAADAIYDKVDAPFTQLDIDDLNLMRTLSTVYEEGDMISVLESLEDRKVPNRRDPDARGFVGVARDVLQLLQSMRDDGSLQYLEPHVFREFIEELYERNREIAQYRDEITQQRALAILRDAYDSE
jgi:hypothetical protein